MNAINLDYLMRRAENRESLGPFEAEQLIRLCRRMEAHAEANPFVTWWTFVEAGAEVDGEPIADEAVVLNFMGNGAGYFVTAGMIRRWLREAPAVIAPGVLVPRSKSEAKRFAAQTDEPEPVARVPVAGVFDATAPEPFDPEPAPMPAPVVEAFAQVERSGEFDGGGASGNWDASPSSTESYSSASDSGSSSGGD